MSDNKISVSYGLKILGCITFDMALILAFFKAFGLFIIIAPVKSILMLFTLIIGLFAINIAVIMPSNLYKKIGIPYSVSLITFFVLYGLSANVLSIFLIRGSAIWYIIWELIIFAVFIGILSVLTIFSGSEMENISRVENEQYEKTSIMIELLEIEDMLNKMHEDDKFSTVLNSFNNLKERIQASTPFGRILDNNVIQALENQIKGNLISFKIGLQEKSEEGNFTELQNMIEETRRLVIKREKLNIK